MHGSHRGIELFGLPGAGKSTLGAELLAVHRQQAARPRLEVEVPVKPRGRISAMLAARVAMRYAVRDRRGCAQLVFRPSGHWLLLKLGHRMAGLQIRGDLENRLLADSGVLQPLVSFDVEHNLSLIDWDVRHMVPLLPLPARAIYVRVAPEVAMKRYLEREHHQGRWVNADRLEERFARGFMTAEALYSAARESGVRCIKHENDSLVTPDRALHLITTLLDGRE